MVYDIMVYDIILYGPSFTVLSCSDPGGDPCRAVALNSAAVYKEHPGQQFALSPCQENPQPPTGIKS